MRNGYKHELDKHGQIHSPWYVYLGICEVIDMAIFIVYPPTPACMVMHIMMMVVGLQEFCYMCSDIDLYVGCFLPQC